MTSQATTDTVDSKAKTQKSCFQMFTKWQNSLEKNKDKNTVAHYVHACINGYPKGTKINPSLLKTRVNGIVAYTTSQNEPVGEKEVTKAFELIEKYRGSFKASKATAE